MLKKAMSVLLALVMLLTLVPFGFAAEAPDVSCRVSSTSSGVRLVFFCGPVTNLTNAIFRIEYDTEALEFVKASESKTVIDGDEYTNFQGVWAFGERIDATGTAVGFVSAYGVTKKSSTAMFEVELKFKSAECESADVKVLVSEFATNDGNSDNDIASSDEAIVLLSKTVTPPGDFLYGDVNGDGALTPSDVVQLRRYFANYDSDSETSTIEVSLGADVNGDGSLTPSDVVLLRRYFANYDSETGTSTIQLGPQ